MKSSGIKTSTVLASFLLAACLSMRAEVKLPAIFSDGMVMQQQTNANLWGTATPNKKVTVTTGWNGKQYEVTADKNGAWKLSVSTPEAGGPYTITFDDGTQKTLNNILIGELWLCSGQSNMEMPMKGFIPLTMMPNWKPRKKKRLRSVSVISVRRPIISEDWSMKY